jgi:predicted PurR-regulated permease PerM
MHCWPRVFNQTSNERKSKTCEDEQIMSNDQPVTGTPTEKNMARRQVVLMAIALTAVALILVWIAHHVLLVLFAGVLFGVFLNGLAIWTQKGLRCSYGWALAAIVLALTVLATGGVWLLTARVAAQASQLAESLPKALEHLQIWMAGSDWGQQVLSRLPAPKDLLPDDSHMFSRATGIFSSALGVLANFVIILFVGLYTAMNPQTYARGITALFPLPRRGRIREVIGTLHLTLRRWLLGRLALMALNGIVTTVALWLLGVPLALTLGLISAALNFIPNLGPIIAAVPAVLIALLQSPAQALYVLMLYIGYQSIDGYLLTPMVSARTVSLPPAMTISAQVLMGVLFGTLGLLLATPLTACLLVIVQMLYVEDALGDKRSTEHG